MSRAMVLEDLFKIERLSDFCLSVDGNQAWLVTKTIDLNENKTTTHTSHLDCNSGELTEGKLHEKGASGICFSADGKRIFYAADGQIYSANADGSEPRCITHGRGGASTPLPSADGRYVLFVRTLYENEELQKKSETTTPTLADIYGLQHPKANARIADKLMYRHWDAWTENKRNHLFIAKVETGEMCDLTPSRYDVPPIALGSARDYDISPDGKYVVYVMNPDQMTACSTNQSIYIQKLRGMEPDGDAECVSTSMANDIHPRFISATKIAYCAMLEPGYEADAVRIKVYDMETRETKLFLEHFERSVDSFVPLSETRILFNAEDFAHESLFELNLENDSVIRYTRKHSYLGFAASKSGRVLARLEALNMPAELVSLENLQALDDSMDWPETPSQETVRYYTHYRKVLEDVALDRGDSLTYKAADGTTLEGWYVLPPNFDPKKKYPLILLIHGGPQGAFQDSFHYRWNVEMFASRGAVVAFCNPRGSTGYGHQLTRDISGRWSDECPDDIMRFVDAILEKCPFIDPDRLAAAGASFGGYMINWLMGHTDRFKAFVSHDGIFNTEMSAYVTDELWFNEHEFGGRPYECPEAYTRHSPHRFVKNFRTPTLVIQGEQDFRCFISEGVALFTALQYMGVESRLLYLPTEGHWVLTPANAYVWYSEVLHWLMSHLNTSEDA